MFFDTIGMKELGDDREFGERRDDIPGKTWGKSEHPKTVNLHLELVSHQKGQCIMQDSRERTQ